MLRTLLFALISALALNVWSAEGRLADGVGAMSHQDSKHKEKTQGKKGGGGWMKGYLTGETAGDTFGYEFHAPAKRSLVLDNAGFFYCEGDSQMTSMKFKITVYDMSEVEGKVSDKFVAVGEPIYFDCQLEQGTAGKYEYKLPNPVALPKDAMVVIEMLENLDGQKLWFKSNLMGKGTWDHSASTGKWMKNPYAAPFFVNCLETKDE